MWHFRLGFGRRLKEATPLAARESCLRLQRDPLRRLVTRRAAPVDYETFFPESQLELAEYASAARAARCESVVSIRLLAY